MNSPVVTISLFRYRTISSRFWAFRMMQFAHQHLRHVSGLRFYRMLGTGKRNGFYWKADFSTYALLMVWEHEHDAKSFITTSRLYQLYRQHTEEQYSIFMKPLKSHGKWSGTNPFKPDDSMNGDAVAVITRATIYTKHLYRFWKNVPEASHSLRYYPGLIYATGIGEWPIKQMATFSLWENEDSMAAYAYKNKDHLKVIKKTRQLKWYKEELFARFRPYHSIGTWEGQSLLPF